MNMIKQKIIRYIKSNRKISEWLLNRFVKMHNYSYHKISELARYLNNDIHPKHEITNYHKYFLDNVNTKDNVLDLGCGNGFLSYDVAKKANKVIGIDIRQGNIESAKKNYSLPNLEFIIGDATAYQFNGKFDVIILSNVLEHISERIDLLKKLKNISNKILIRVPMIDRDWLAMYKKMNGFEYKLDSTHEIEYTLDSLKNELGLSGWQLGSYQVNWGELWGVVEINK